jgi:hypothetical protein
MIISNSHKFIFVHILKTAGTSICAALDPTLRWNDVILGGTGFGEKVNAPYKERFGLRKHSSASQIRAVVGDDVWSQYFKFAFIRHPYTRVVSFYTWLGEVIRRNADPAAPVWTWTSTQAFVESPTFSDFIRNEKFLQTEAARPQTEWLCDEEGRCMVDFVGRFENLDAGMLTVVERLGLSVQPLGRHNSSATERPPTECLCLEADYEHLEQLFRRDFDRFGYDPALRFPPSV